MKVIKCTQLHDDYCGVKDDSKYRNSTAFYNKTNENYSILAEQKIINPVIIFKSKISHMDCVNDDNNGGREDRGRGQFCG